MVVLSYIIKYDYGFAPNPFWETLTLTLCKSPIRIDAPKLKELHKELWIIGTGSVNVHRSDGSYKDYSGKLVFAMKVSEVLTLKDYDRYCITLNSTLKDKIPKKVADLRIQVGDCVYKYPVKGDSPIQRLGLHCSKHKEDDLKGKYSLHSDDFYYFGANAVSIPKRFDSLLMAGQGYKKNEDDVFISSFNRCSDDGC